MSTIPAFKRLKQQNRVIQDLQTNVGGVLDPLGQNILLQGVLASVTIRTFTPAGTDIVIGHGLGSTPVGIIPLVAQQSPLFSSNASFVQSSSNNPNSTVFMILKCSADLKPNAIFSFWVF